MKSIRYFYFISITVILIVSMLVLGLMQAYLSTTYFNGEKQNLLQKLVRGVAEGTQEGISNGTERELGAIEYMAGIAGAVVVITDAEGNVVFAANAEEMDMELPAQVPATVLAKVASKEMYSEIGKLDGYFTYGQYIAATALYNSAGVLIGYIIAASPTAGLSVYLSSIMSGFVLSAALVLLVAGVVALLLTNRMVVPLQRISETARKFGAGDYSARVPVEGDDELAELAITFNEMANSFESTDVSRRSFMGNIAHELRTPMTTIKGFVDGILDGTIPEEQRQNYLEIVSEEVGRLARLTKNMLDISRLEAGEYSPQVVTFDIWKPIVSVLVNAQKRIDSGGIDVQGLEDITPVQVQADEDFVHQVLQNLVDNAVKFTNAGGVITVKVESYKNVVTVGIKNTGTGISQDALPHLFDRFYKEDQSRGQNAKGAGLGLHICRVLVGRMGGRIWATTQEGEWSEFSFTLPGAQGRK